MSWGDAAGSIGSSVGQVIGLIFQLKDTKKNFQDSIKAATENMAAQTNASRNALLTAASNQFNLETQTERAQRYDSDLYSGGTPQIDTKIDYILPAILGIGLIGAVTVVLLKR